MQTIKEQTNWCYFSLFLSVFFSSKNLTNCSSMTLITLNTIKQKNIIKKIVLIWIIAIGHPFPWLFGASATFEWIIY